MLDRTGTDKEFMELVEKHLRRLTMTNPFVGLSLGGMAITIREDLTAEADWSATDDYQILYNPTKAREAMKKIGFDHTDSSLCHEWVHIFDNHMRRRGSRNHDLWNWCSDQHAVRQGCLLAKLPSDPEAGRPVPPDGIQPEEWTEKLSTEEIYATLPNLPEEERKEEERKNAGKKCSSHMIITGKNTPSSDGSLTPADLKFRTEVIKLVGIVSNLPHKMNALATNDWLRKRVTSIMKGWIPWGNILRANMIEGLGHDYPTYCPPNRRYLPKMVLPSLRKLTTKKLQIAIDVSGSVDSRMLSMFRAQVVPAASHASEILVQAFDDRIREEHLLRDWRQLDKALQLKTGSHVFTSVEDVLQRAAAYKPQVLIIATDGLIKIGNIVYPRTVWVLPNSAPMPFGRSIQVTHGW